MGRVTRYPLPLPARCCLRRVTGRITAAGALTTCNQTAPRANSNQLLPRRSVSWPAVLWARGRGCFGQRLPQIEVKARRRGRDRRSGQRDERQPERRACGSRAWIPWPRRVFVLSSCRMANSRPLPEAARSARRSQRPEDSQQGRCQRRQAWRPRPDGCHTGGHRDVRLPQQSRQVSAWLPAAQAHRQRTGRTPASVTPQGSQP